MGVTFVNTPHLLKMLPQFYLLHLQQQLKNSEYLTLKILVYLLQAHKQVSLELLASLLPYPIQFESRRRSLQRFLKSSALNIEAMFKHCKTGGYNLEKSHANNERLKSLILLIALAYTCAVL